MSGYFLAVEDAPPNLGALALLLGWLVFLAVMYRVMSR